MSQETKWQVSYLWSTEKDRGSHSRFCTFLHELDSSDEDKVSDNTPGTSMVLNGATLAWLKEFNMYLNTTDEIPKGQTIVQWWGVSLHNFCVSELM